MWVVEMKKLSKSEYFVVQVCDEHKKYLLSSGEITNFCVPRCAYSGCYRPASWNGLVEVVVKSD